MVVYFIAVAVAFFYVGTAVDGGGQAAGGELHFLRAQAHGAAQIGVFVAFFHRAVGGLPFINQRHHGIGRFQIEFGGVGAFHAGHMAGKLDERNLHTEADAQIGHFVFAGIAGGGDFTFHTAHAETAGHQDGIEVFQAVRAFGFDVFTVDIGDAHFGFGVDAGVLQGFAERWHARFCAIR